MTPTTPTSLSGTIHTTTTTTRTTDPDRGARRGTGTGPRTSRTVRRCLCGDDDDEDDVEDDDDEDEDDEQCREAYLGDVLGYMLPKSLVYLFQLLY